MIDLTIVCASYRQDVFDNNLGPCLKHGTAEFVAAVTTHGKTNVAAAYNNYEFRAGTRYVMYVHEDVLLPEGFFDDLEKALKLVPEDFGVLGVAGVRITGSGEREFRGYLDDRGKQWGSPYDLPAEVDTLDEVLLITHGDLPFDENLPLDFYGADICMTAKARGLKNYAINAYCHHNSTRVTGGRTPAFYEAQEYFKQKWFDRLPIGTTCALIK